MKKKIFAVFLAAVMVAGIAGCGKKADADDRDAAVKEPKKTARKVVDLMGSIGTEEYTIDTADFLKSGGIEKSVIFSERDVEITAESLEYLDDRAVLNLSVSNSGSSLIGISKALCALNGLQNMDIGYFYIPAGETEKWEYDIPYSSMYGFGVKSIDSIRLGLQLYRVNGNPPADEFAVPPDSERLYPDGVSGLSLDDFASVSCTELIKTENYAETEYDEEVMEEVLKSFAGSTGYPLMRDLLCGVFPEDPLVNAEESGYADQYFMQETEQITNSSWDENTPYPVMSVAFGKIKNEESPDNRWFQYSVYNSGDEPLTVKTENVIINGLSVTSRTSLTGMPILPHTADTKHDIMFVTGFNKAHCDIYGIDSFRSIAFDYTVTKQGESSGTQYHAEAVFEDGIDPPDISGDTVYEKDGVKIISKGIYEDSAFYVDDLTLALVVENDSPDPVYFSVPTNIYGGKVKFFSVNDGEAEAYIKITDASLKVPSGGKGAFLVNIDRPSLEKINVKSVSDIRKIRLDCMLRDYRERLTDQPELEIELK